jgi:hypothetical protein
MMVISDAQIPIDQFQKVCSKLLSQETAVSGETNWNNSIQHTKHIMDVGRRVGERKVETFLRGGREALFDSGAEEISELLYRRSGRTIEHHTWGDVAKKQEKAVMRLINTLPRD